MSLFTVNAFLNAFVCFTTFFFFGELYILYRTVQIEVQVSSFGNGNPFFWGLTAANQNRAGLEICEIFLLS
jgi:hypothetical protein